MPNKYFSHHPPQKSAWQRWQQFWKQLHLDLHLLIGLGLLITFGLSILYSASNENLSLITHQAISIGIALGVMCLFAQIPLYKYRAYIPWIFAVAIFMLMIVLGSGIVSKGAQRWLNFGILRFQPSEIMKLLTPLMLAWYLRDKILPPNWQTLGSGFLILLLPVIMIAKQPDLGTAIIIASSGIFVLLLAGIRWQFLAGIIGAGAITLPLVWQFLHNYQQKRIFIFLDPSQDPLGSGYNIIQSKIAIGSGGLFGKGWLFGSQTHLQFLPEHTTDFIFAVCGEEFGFIGCLILLAILLYIVGRGLYISSCAQDNFTRLLSGSLILTCFTSFFVNIGMVIGLLPVVGVPLPIISYGGSALVTLFASFGIIMSIHTHRKLMSN